MTRRTFFPTQCAAAARAVLAGLIVAAAWAPPCTAVAADEAAVDEAVDTTDQDLARIAAERKQLIARFRAIEEIGSPEQRERAEDELTAAVNRLNQQLADLLSERGLPEASSAVRDLHFLSKKLVELETAEVKASHEEQYALARRKIEETEKQLQEVLTRRELPPLENAEIKVFSLKFSKAKQAAETIEALLGPGPMRVAVDERANALIVAGKADAITVAEALVMKLDQPADSDSKPAAIDPADAPRSLMVRTFWLADGLPKGEGTDPAKFLPRSVLAAMDQLGLDEPRLVAQTVNSLSRDNNPARDVQFSTHVPALVFKHPAQLDVSGKIFPVREGRVELEVVIQVGGPLINAQLGGSLATPLGHYMVLGTANSVSGGPAMGQALGAMGGMGMEGGYGRGGYGGEFGGRGGMDGGRGGEFGRGEMGASGPIDPVTGMPIGADGNPVPAADAKFDTSHFAFVVQVIEAESFADEE